MGNWVKALIWTLFVWVVGFAVEVGFYLFFGRDSVEIVGDKIKMFDFEPTFLVFAIVTSGIFAIYAWLVDLKYDWTGQIQRKFNKPSNPSGPPITPKPVPTTKVLKVEPDVSFVDAVYYVATGEWNYKFPKDEHDEITPKIMSAVDKAKADIQQKAFDGDLPVWGKSVSSPTVLKKIDPGFWEHVEITLETFFKYESDELLVAGVAFGGSKYNNLMTNKEKVKELFPYKQPEITPDFVSIHEAVEHVAKILNPKIDFSNYHIGNDFGPPCTLITEKLRSGELVARGKRFRTTQDSNRTIDKKDWEYRQLKPISCLHWHDDRPQTESRGSSEDHIQFTALKVDLNKVKKLWPVESI